MVMTWQNGRQLKSIKVDDSTTLEFTYDINGQRQSKVEKKNGTAVHTTKYYYDGTKLVGENKDGTIVWYDYDENGTPIGMRLSGDDYVFRRNLQGDITGIFDSSGTAVVEYTYGNSWGFGITVSGSKAAEIGACNSLRYRGYYYDSESGLYYLNTRYYDPSLCRFVNADELLNQTDMQGFNLYSYCFNNPVVYVDPDGTCPYNGTAADFRNLEAGRPPMNCTCVGGNVKDIIQASSHDVNRRPYTGKPGSTYKAPNGDSRTYGPDGTPEHDYDHDDHGRPDKHPHDSNGGHNHDWKNGVRGPSYSIGLEPIAGVALVTVCIIGIVVVAADDATGIGVADDFLFGPLGAGVGEGLILIFG